MDCRLDSNLKHGDKYDMITKETIEPSTALYPVPVVLVSCTSGDNSDNIITIAWTGTVCSDPPMLSISVRRERFSHRLIQDSGEFVVNIPTRELLSAVRLCGTKSGRDIDKWSETGFTRELSHYLDKKTPLIQECPVNIECVTRQQLSLGSHDMFIGEIVAVHRMKNWHSLNKDAISFVAGSYHELGEKM